MDVDLTIHQMIECYSEKEPKHIAMIDGGSFYSYRELNQKANQLAHFLQKNGLKQGSFIAVSIDRSPQFIIAILAILKSGCCYLPLDARHPKDRLAYLLKDTQTSVLITHSKSKDKFSGYLGHLIQIDQVWDEINTFSSQNLSNQANPENLAYIIYTSGSTGKPKGVLIEHRSVVNYTKWFNEYSNAHPQDCIDCSSSVIFDMAVTTTITALALGLKIVICPDEIKKNISQYLLFLKKNKVNLIKITPSYFKIVIQEAMNQALELPDLQSIILGGEMLETKDCHAWLDMFPKHNLFNEYGLTETTVAVTQYKVTNENVSNLREIVPIGKPGMDTELKILNEKMESVSLVETGELYVSGLCLARGYLNQEELTFKQFIDYPLSSEYRKRYYRTGDLCRYLPDGNIEFIKRMDNQIKILGYRIEPGEIEACIASHPMIKENYVIAREGSSGEKQLIAYYLSKDENESPNQKDLRQFLQQKLADYMIPASFVRMTAFPLTENGKLDKKALPNPLSNDEVTIPRTQIEQRLIDIWQKEFHINNIVVNSNFFELGGHSLISTRIIAEIEKHFSKKIQLEDLYKFPTIRELASIIMNAESSKQMIIPVPVSQNKNVVIPLGDFQFIFWISKFFEPKIRKLNIVTRRRVSGKIDVTALRFVLEQIFHKHEILGYQISKYFPFFYKGKNIKIQMIEHDFNTFSETVVESELSSSLDELIKKSLWQKKQALIVVKLFHLKNNMSELQISASHMCFDDASEEILFSELSKVYLHYKNGSRDFPINDCLQYKDYILYEKTYLNQNLERDIKFWQRYLHDTSLITFPENEIIENMENIPYSTYLDLPTELVEIAYNICTHTSISITDFLCASVSLSLKGAAGYLNNNIYINIIRSVRENDNHDKMLGCFLRLDPIKVDLKTNLNIIELAKAIQQSRIETEPYQSCSGMVKLACLDKTYRNKFIRNSIIHIISSLYCKIFKKLKLNSTMLSMFGRLNLLRTKQQFLVNINLLNNFVSPNNDKMLFGFPLEKTQTQEYDLSEINNVIDISFLRNHTTEKIYLVISANLKQSFRQRIGNEIIELIRACQLENVNLSNVS